MKEGEREGGREDGRERERGIEGGRERESDIYALPVHVCV